MRRLLVPLAVLATAVCLAGCGNKGRGETVASTEGTYLQLGNLKYQVQISRLLNPASTEDRDYFIGLDPAQRQLPAGQQWFAVFMRVENDSKATARAATDYTITDTQGTKFRPLPLGADNVFAYRGGGTLAPKDILPAPDSPPGQGSIQGSLLLFKIPVRNFENRPFELTIRAPDVPGKTAAVDLDV